MNGKQLLERALLLLNYVDAAGEPHFPGVNGKRAVSVINQIAADLLFARQADAAFTPMVRLDEAIPLDERTVENVMPYGVAMLLAQSEGDADGQALFAAIYNRKRAAVGGLAQTRRDVLPR